MTNLFQRIVILFIVLIMIMLLLLIYWILSEPEALCTNFKSLNFPYCQDRERISSVYKELEDNYGILSNNFSALTEEFAMCNGTRYSCSYRLNKTDSELQVCNFRLTTCQNGSIRCNEIQQNLSLTTEESLVCKQQLSECIENKPVFIDKLLDRINITHVADIEKIFNIEIKFGC